MENYLTLWEENEFELTEKKSRFIATAARVENKEEANLFVAAVKAKYPDARHNCYGYLCHDGYSKYSDDGEPSGTAGMPILNCIKQSGLCDVAIVVTRYFGGILLGTGGLTRAYSSASSGAIGTAQKAIKLSVSRFCTTCDYKIYDTVIQKNFADATIAEQSFEEQVNLQFDVETARENEFLHLWNETFFGKYLPKKVGESAQIVKYFEKIK